MVLKMAKQTKLVTYPGFGNFCHHRNLPVVMGEPASPAAKKSARVPCVSCILNSCPNC